MCRQQQPGSRQASASQSAESHCQERREVLPTPIRSSAPTVPVGVGHHEPGQGRRELSRASVRPTVSTTSSATERARRRRSASATGWLDQALLHHRRAPHQKQTHPAPTAAPRPRGTFGPAHTETASHQHCPFPASSAHPPQPASPPSIDEPRLLDQSSRAAWDARRQVRRVSPSLCGRSGVGLPMQAAAFTCRRWCGFRTLPGSGPGCQPPARCRRFRVFTVPCPSMASCQPSPIYSNEPGSLRSDLPERRALLAHGGAWGRALRPYRARVADRLAAASRSLRLIRPRSSSGWKNWNCALRLPGSAQGLPTTDNVAESAAARVARAIVTVPISETYMCFEAGSSRGSGSSLLRRAVMDATAHPELRHGLGEVGPHVPPGAERACPRRSVEDADSTGPTSGPTMISTMPQSICRPEDSAEEMPETTSPPRESTAEGPMPQRVPGPLWTRTWAFAPSRAGARPGAAGRGPGRDPIGGRPRDPARISHRRVRH